MYIYIYKYIYLFYRGTFSIHSSEFLRQDSQSSYSFGKIQNVGETELSEEKI